MDCRITYVGTATFLLEIGGLRLLTDPVFDPAGSRETLRVRLLGRLGLDFPLVKLTGPALSADELPVRVTGVPALHGPRLLKRYIGDVTGFVLEWKGQRHGALYVSGDTVLFGDRRDRPAEYQRV